MPTVEEMDIKAWVRRCLDMRKVSLDEEEIDHVTKCIHHLYLWYHEGLLIGNFLRAVLRDNLSESISRADDTNLKVLWIYPMFLHNKLPGNWRERAKGGQ